MRLSLAVAFLACLVLVGSACGGYEAGENAVAVRIQEEYDESHGLYIEGSYSYVRVEELDGTKLLEERLDDHGGARLRLDPGTYRFSSYQRPCEGNCGSLDPPADECEKVIRIRGETEVRIYAGAGVPCRFASMG
jgi:hypothetical protein